MARQVETSSFKVVPLTGDQKRVGEQLKSLLGFKPESVRMLQGRSGGCAVAKVRLGISGTAEFILDNGLLVGLPPLTRR
jgi:hypothetical protein